MKTFLKSLVLITAFAIPFSACTQKEDLEPSNPNEQVTLKFNIRNADDATITKALLGTENNKNFLNWENGDKIGTFSVGSFGSGENVSTESKNNSGTVEVDGNDYTLNVQVFNAGSITNIYSYYPYSASAGKDKTSAIVTIPESQIMNDSGFDADAMPMAGTPITVDLTNVSANTDTNCGTISFSNLGSVIKFRVYSSDPAKTGTLTSVTYKAPNIGGAFTIDLTAVDASNASTLGLIASDPISEITTSYISTTHPTIGIGENNAIDVYMVVAPGTYDDSQVIVTTNEHTYTLNASGAKIFTRSHVKPIKVDISNGIVGDLPSPETWTKVTSATDFTAGTYYILRADGAYYVPNTEGNPSCISYSSGSKITDGMKWTATVSGNGLIFESCSATGKYLWTTNTGSANTISVATSSTGANASNVWTFDKITVNNNTYYTATAGANKYLVSYGTSNWRYYATSAISDSNIPAEFYKLDVVDNTPRFSVTSPLEATAAADVYPVTVTRTNFDGAITVSVPAACDWVNANDVAANATTFNVTVSENTGPSRTVTLTLNGSGVDSRELVINQAGVDYVTLPWSYPSGNGSATSSGIQAETGVTASGLGSDYAAGNAPYQIKLDTTGDYFQIKTDSAIDRVSVKYMMLGGSTSSSLTFEESANGTDWSSVQVLSIAGAQNSTGILETSNAFNAGSRYVKITFTKGANVGIGGISITKASNDPAINAADINVTALGATNAEASYSIVHFTGSDDVSVKSFDGCVTAASIVSSGIIQYSVNPNYGTGELTGTIVLQSSEAPDKTVNVTQSGDTFSQSGASGNVLTIGADANTATFTVTSAVFGYNASATPESGMNLSISSGDSGDASALPQTITVSSTTAAPTSGDPLTLGTIVVYRNGNTDDSQKISITVKKALSGAESIVYTLTPASGSNSTYASNCDITIDGITWNLTGNSQQIPWRIGGKSLSDVDRTLYSKTALNYNISKIVITHGAASSITVNSMTVIVAKDASFSTVVSTLTPTFTANGTVTVERPEGKDWKDCYYKIVYNVTVSGTSNKFIEFTKAEFTGK